MLHGDGLTCTAACGREGGGKPSCGSRQAAPSPQSLMWHASDTVARPLVGNKAIERVARPTCDPAALHFPALVLAPASRPAACQSSNACSAAGRHHIMLLSITLLCNAMCM